MIIIFQNGTARLNAVATTQEKPNTPIALFMDGFALSPMAALVLTEDNQETRES